MTYGVDSLPVQIAGFAHSVYLSYNLAWDFLREETCVSLFPAAEVVS
jgi:hypothetical protein